MSDPGMSAGEAELEAAADAEASPTSLSLKQQVALAALAKGQTLGRAADAAGVDRRTLYRWIRSHAAFAAAYNAWEQETRESARARLLNAADAAVSKVIGRLEFDYKFAFQVIKELGMLRRGPSLEIDPQRMQKEMEVEVKELDRRLRDRAAGFAESALPARIARKITVVRHLIDDDSAVSINAAASADECPKIENGTSEQKIDPAR